MTGVIQYITNNKIGDYKENVSFKSLTTYKSGGNARLVVYPFDTTSLVLLIKFLKESSVSFKILGNGSNTLASDRDYDGVIVKLDNFNDCILDDNVLYVEAGCNLMVVANNMSREGYSGLEFACGIPGTLGGAIYMNAGAYLKAMQDIVIDILVLDENLELKKMKNEELGFSYRNSILKKKPYIVLSANLKLEKKDRDEIEELINSRKKRRQDSQPLDYPSAGSVFRNPDGDHAGRLIEECGLKGETHGGAEISIKHANFIINKEGASSSDIKYLMDKAHDEVLKKFNVDLIREQELFNWK